MSIDHDDILPVEHCKCGSMSRYAASKHTPIEYCSMTNRYFIKTQSRCQIAIHYCFHCGSKLPPSNVPEYDAEMTATLDRLEGLLREAGTEEDYVRLLGPPGKRRKLRRPWGWRRFPTSVEWPKEELRYDLTGEKVSIVIWIQADGHTAMHTIQPRVPVVRMRPGP